MPPKLAVKYVTLMTIIVIFLIFGSFVRLGNIDANVTTNIVPTWVKHIALLWSQAEISDTDFVNNMRWLVEHRIIPVEDLVENVDGFMMPDSIKKIAYSWSHGDVPDSEFVLGIEYLIQNGVIEMDDNFVSRVQKEGISQISVHDDTKKSVVIIPVFTASAYSERCFYSYYAGNCDTACLTSFIYTDVPLGYTASGQAVDILESLGYCTLTDVDVDKNPKILLQYDKVILLHNEYVTQKEFDAITTHQHVIYLYPNAWYGIVVNYSANVMMLVRGHNYPDVKIHNGFDWKFDNSNL